MIILDTNVLSEIIRPEPEPAVKTWLAGLADEEIATTAVTVAELLHGVVKMSPGRRRRELARRVATMLGSDYLGDRVFPFDAGAAPHYAAVLVARAAIGRPIATADAEIAAICRCHEFRLATRNIKDFADTGIKLINPWH